MSTQWSEIRRDFPAVTNCVYLNAAAASPTPRPVRAAVDAFYRRLEEEGDAPWDEWLAQVEAVRARVARFVGADADEVVFVPNTSAGVNLIVDLLAEDGPVLAVEPEFPTITLPWIHRGVDVRFVKPEGRALPPTIFTDGRAPQAATIAVSHVQFSDGARVDLEALGALKARRSLVVIGRAPASRSSAARCSHAGGRAPSGGSASRTPTPSIIGPTSSCPPRSAASWAARPSRRSSPWARPSTTSRRSASTRSRPGS